MHDRLPDRFFFAEQLVFHFIADDADALSIRVVARVDLPSSRQQPRSFSSACNRGRRRAY